MITDCSSGRFLPRIGETRGQLQNHKAMRAVLYLLASVLCLCVLSCDTDDLECRDIEYLETTPRDTLFFGKWQWAFSRVYCWDNWPIVFGNYHISDVIYPGDFRPWMPDGHPDRMIELGQQITITNMGNEQIYCIQRWQSLSISSGSSMYGPTRKLRLHMWYYDDANSYTLSLYQYDALAQDTIEVFPEFKMDSTCGERTYGTIDYYVKVH
jgi:hypothetical protein